MQSATINGAELEYEVVGSGEPLLLISPVLADGFLPLISQPVMAENYQQIRYHKRGWAGSTHTPPPVSIADHAADARALLGHLDVPRAHVAGHSSGAAVAAELALAQPDVVHTLTLLELTLLSVPSGEAFLEQSRPAFEAYERGDHADAFALFMSGVSGLDWTSCRALLEKRVPGMTEQAIRDADTFFGIELPSIVEWELGAERAASVGQPVLSVTGTDTDQLWLDVAAFLRSSLSRVEDRRIDGIGHLLHIQDPEPVARAMTEFLGRHPLTEASASRAREVVS